MAIRMMCDADHPDATLDRYFSKEQEPAKGEYEHRVGPFCSLIYVREFAKGCVVKMREMNGYHDSDFYATYWNGEEFVETCYASTRGWTYPNGAMCDATPEVLDRWIAHKDRQYRVAAVHQRIRFRRERNEAARSAGFTGQRDPQYVRLAYSRGGDALLKLVGSYRANRLRSSFRISLAEQVERWLADPSPSYASPLSAKQLSYL